MKALGRVGVVALIAVGGCVSEAEQARRDQASRIAVAQEKVAQELLDPSSAQFSEVTAGDSSVCGVVRGKNGFGGYGEPVKFVVDLTGRATLDPTGGAVLPLGEYLHEVMKCDFNTEYRLCKGEVISGSLERCFTGWQLAEPGKTVDKEAAPDLCRRALEKRFNEDIRPATFRTKSATVERGEALWRVRLAWEASSDTLSGLSATGHCNVQDDGRVLVTHFRAG